MTDQQLQTVLDMVKTDLGIAHSVRDDYLKNYIIAQNAELARKKVVLDLSSVEDIMLLADYAAWNYRKRTSTGRYEDIIMPRNIEMRIKNRVMRERAADAE